MAELRERTKPSKTSWPVGRFHCERSTRLSPKLNKLSRNMFWQRSAPEDVVCATKDIQSRVFVRVRVARVRIIVLDIAVCTSLPSSNTWMTSCAIHSSGCSSTCQRRVKVSQHRRRSLEHSITGTGDGLVLLGFPDL